MSIMARAGVPRSQPQRSATRSFPFPLKKLLAPKGLPPATKGRRARNKLKNSHPDDGAAVTAVGEGEFNTA
jgi:hypothetical protein